MDKILFKEEQRFNQPWVWLILVPVSVSVFWIFGVAFNKQLVNGEPWGDKPMSDAGLIVFGIFTLLMMIGLTILFYTMKLEVKIKMDGVYYRYPPMIRKFRKISNESIERFEVRKYNPIREYGGWGVKTHGNPKKRRKYGLAYNVKGNIGLQLYLKDGNKILIGTQRSDALKHAMGKMMKA
jgi:hypothetical protein